MSSMIDVQKSVARSVNVQITSSGEKEVAQELQSIVQSEPPVKSNQVRLPLDQIEISESIHSPTPTSSSKKESSIADKECGIKISDIETNRAPEIIIDTGDKEPVTMKAKPSSILQTRSPIAATP